jgi:hypothetical protein
VIHVLSFRFGAKYFFLPDGTRWAEHGYHQVVLVGGRVYDALTGPAGMTAAEYVAYLEELGVSPFVVPVTH